MSHDVASGGGSHPDLLGLLRGELDNEEAAATGRHLEACEECRADLPGLAVGHGLLAHTARTLRPANRPAPELLPAVPPLRRGEPRTARAWARPTALVAAAAVLVAGTALTTERLVRPADETPVAGPVSGRLEPLEGTGRGEVLMAPHGGTVEVTIRTQDLPLAPRGEFYYAWLLEPETNKMLPLGQVGPGGSASFELPDGLVDRYAAVDVSLEHDDGDPGHSVTSVLRGSYTRPSTGAS